MDVTNEESEVPVHDGKIVAKVTRLSWGPGGPAHGLALRQLAADDAGGLAPAGEQPAGPGAGPAGHGPPPRGVGAGLGGGRPEEERRLRHVVRVSGRPLSFSALPPVLRPSSSLSPS